MKKLLSLLVIVALCMFPSGCKAENQSASNTSTGENTASAGASLSGKVGGELTISCYDTAAYKSFLEEAAGLFEEKYPGTEVNVETFSKIPETKSSDEGGQKKSAVQMQDDPQGRADYISKVNTSLMSGEGADILAMDVLPIQKYAESGRLENLAEYMEADPDFNREDYRDNILDAVEYKGGTWFLPTDYTFDYYAYDSTLLKGKQTASFGTGSAFTAEQLIELAASSFDGKTMLFNSPDYTKSRSAGMFGRLLNESYPMFVDLENKKANFSDGSFAKLLDTVKEYAKLGYVPQGVTGQQDAGRIMQQGAAQPTDRYFFKPKSNFSLLQQFNRGSGRKMMMMTPDSVAGIEDDDQIAGIQADKDGKVPFTFEQAYGINANSKNKETAWAFLKFLLGEDMQVSTKLSSSSLPVNNAARAKKAELLLSGAFMGQQGKCRITIDALQEGNKR